MIAAVLMMLAAPPAHADAIDGNWCNPDNDNLEIQGPRIITPGGNRIAGDYDRHGFRYVIPADEARAGVEVDMDLIDDETAPGRGTGAERTHRGLAPLFRGDQLAPFPFAARHASLRPTPIM
ncbi:MAG: hypothetical protein CL566_08365 [Alphaproteobacteria bacterium]|nr:hypothetical protein [Alphaproteobacteria bacterium]